MFGNQNPQFAGQAAPGQPVQPTAGNMIIQQGMVARPQGKFNETKKNETKNETKKIKQENETINKWNKTKIKRKKLNKKMKR